MGGEVRTMFNIHTLVTTLVTIIGTTSWGETEGGSPPPSLLVVVVVVKIVVNWSIVGSFW